MRAPATEVKSTMTYLLFRFYDSQQVVASHEGGGLSSELSKKPNSFAVSHMNGRRCVLLGLLGG